MDRKDPKRGDETSDLGEVNLAFDPEDHQQSTDWPTFKEKLARFNTLFPPTAESKTQQGYDQQVSILPLTFRPICHNLYCDILMKIFRDILR